MAAKSREFCTDQGTPVESVRRYSVGAQIHPTKQTLNSSVKCNGSGESIQLCQV